jgi:hypothetical protein
MQLRTLSLKSEDGVTTGAPVSGSSRVKMPAGRGLLTASLKATPSLLRAVSLYAKHPSTWPALSPGPGYPPLVQQSWVSESTNSHRREQTAHAADARSTVKPDGLPD